MRSIFALTVCGLLLVGGHPAGADTGKRRRGAAKPISWSELGELDYRTGKMPGALAKKLKATVKIEGYVIPLEGDGKGITAFVLVSDPMYCGHVPPPPPNQLILVELKKPRPWRDFEGNIFITGKLAVTDQSSDFGGHMYEMKKLAKLEPGPSIFDVFR
ncbi:MAG: DUF3299 domain-containing protein [Myxococcota bacterium]